MTRRNSDQDREALLYTSTFPSRLGEIKVYAPPDDQPRCACQGQPMKAFFCPWGHMLECHVGMSCGEARCSHLLQYATAEEDLGEDLEMGQ